MDMLIINRTKWLRGEHGSYLRRKSDGKMCCLGFDCMRRGFDPERITGKQEPIELAGTPTASKMLTGLIVDDDNSHVCYDLMDINDNQDIADKERERQLIEKFKYINVAVRFVDSVKGEKR